MNENVTNIDNIKNHLCLCVFFLNMDVGYCIIYATILCHYRNNVRVKITEWRFKPNLQL